MAKRFSEIIKNPPGRPSGKWEKKHHIARNQTAKKIFDLFVRPLLEEFIVPHDPEFPNETQKRLEMFFCKDTRHVWAVKCIEPFKILGPAWKSPDTPLSLFVDGSGDRNVRPGDFLWIRFDSTRPDITEVEFKDQVFNVRTYDWNELSLKCEEV